MKKTRKVTCLLLTFLFVLGMAVTAHAAPAANRPQEFMRNGIVYGQFPRFTDDAYKALNDQIYNYLFTLFSGFSVTNPTAQNIVGVGATNLDLIRSSIVEDGDFNILTISVNPRHGVVAPRVFYIDTVAKKEATKDAFDAYVKDRDAGGASASVTATPQKSLLEQVNDALDAIRKIPVVADSEGYVSLKRYADAIGGVINFNERTGGINVTINRIPVIFDIDPALWSTNPNIKINAPIYLVGDDVLVHATLIYPIYSNAKASVTANGVVLLSPK